MRRLALVACLLAGCTTAKLPAWQIYAKASYYYGRMEAKAETLCAAPTKATTDVCKEAAQDQRLVREIAPQVEAELSKSSPDWPTILKYVDLVLGLAVKFVP